MRILVVEDEIGSSVDAILDLVDAGHRVVRCQPVGGEVEPCAGMTGGECPLTERVDVVVQIHGGDRMTLRELGALCAARDGAPVVSVGHTPPPYRTIRTSRDDLVETVASLDSSVR